MKILQSTLLALALLLPTAAAQSAQLRNADRSAETHQEITGAVGSYLPLIAQSKQDTWVLVKIITDQLSGCATPSGFTTISGSYRVVQQLGVAAAGRAGRYSWSQPSAILRSAFQSGRPDPAEARWFASQLFSYRTDDGRTPQSATRYLICILHEKAAGQDKFTNVHLVPEGWQNDLLSAVIYLRAHPKLGDLNAAASDQTQLRGLLHSPNPYLVLTALQLLAASKSLTPADMDVVLSSTDVIVIASSLVIARLYSWSDIDNNAKWLTDRVNTIKSLEQLEGVANGILAASPFGMMMSPSPITDLSGNIALSKPQTSNYATSLIPLVRQKLKELDPNDGTVDVEWRDIDSICREFGA